MPSYAKFLKEILGNKRKLEDYKTVKLNRECSAIILNKLPPKLKDPGSFTIPCTIGNYHFDKVLCDLGASINLMPLSIMQKLGLEEPKPTVDAPFCPGTYFVFLTLVRLWARLCQASSLDLEPIPLCC